MGFLEDDLGLADEQWESENSSRSARDPGSLDARVASDCMATFVRTGRSGQFDDEHDVLVNPESFKESIATSYSLRAVLGLSHEVVQYIRTGSRKISMELWLSWHILRLKKGPAAKLSELIDTRNWFEGCMVPQGLGLAPPLVLLLWPGAKLNFIGVIDSLNIEYQRFTTRARPMEIKLDISMIEVASKLMTTPGVTATGMGTGGTR